MTAQMFSQQAHATIDALKTMGGLTGNVYQLRDKARAAVKSKLTEIDTIVRRVLGL